MKIPKMHRGLHHMWPLFENPAPQFGCFNSRCAFMVPQMSDVQH